MNNKSNHNLLSDFEFSSTDPQLAKLSKKEKCSNRNSGKAYATKSGKIVPERSVKPLESCRRNCKSKVTPEDQNKIFNDYWEKGSYEHRFHFVSKLVKLEPKKRDRSRINIIDRQINANYHFIINSNLIKVCKKCFLQTLGENHGFIRNVIVKCWTGKDKDPVLDGRGKHSPKNKTCPEKIMELENHIRRFPIFEEHCPYMHRIKYLPEGFNAMKMYDLYAAEVKEPLSKNMYRKVLAETGLKFKNISPNPCTECNQLEYKVSDTLEMNKDEYSQNDDEVLSLDRDSSQFLQAVEKEKEFYNEVEAANNTEYNSVKSSLSPIKLEMEIDKFEVTKKMDSEPQPNDSGKIQNEVKKDQSTVIEIEVDPIIFSTQANDDLEDEATDEIITDYPTSKTDERTRRSLLKNSGEAYVTESGKYIPKRTVKLLDKCKSNCRLKISPEDQNRIFDSYWKEGDYKHRLNFVANLVTLYSPKVRTVVSQKNRKFSCNYYLPSETEKIQVCKKCFLQTLGENDGFIKNVLNKCWNNRLFSNSEKKNKD